MCPISTCISELELDGALGHGESTFRSAMRSCKAALNHYHLPVACLADLEFAVTKILLFVRQVSVRASVQVLVSYDAGPGVEQLQEELSLYVFCCYQLDRETLQCCHCGTED